MAGICAFLSLHRDEPESPLLRRPAECPPSFFYDCGLTFDPRHARKKFRQAPASSARVSGRQIDPVDGADLVAHSRLGPYPAGDERRNAFVFGSLRGKSLPRVKGDDLRLNADLLHELPGKRGGHCLADLDGAPGRLKWPSSGISARRTISTLPFRNTTAETARMGRAGDNGPSSPFPRPSISSGDRSHSLAPAALHPGA
jgi:hypothetical protein